MKSNKILSVSIIVLVLSCLNLFAQDNEIIFKAMQDELNRNIENLKLDGLQDPFFIKYSLERNNKIEVRSTLGAITQSTQKEKSIPSVRLMVGSYQLNDENFSDQTSFFFGGSSRPDYATVEDDYYSIRRAFWLQTDKVYKSAAEKYEKKLSAIESQNLSEELRNLPDYVKVDPIVKEIPSVQLIMDKGRMENIAIELSSLFKGQSDITTSNVVVTFYNSDIYMTNSEGSKVKDNLSLIKVSVNASSQADDGMNFDDMMAFYSNDIDGLPSIDEMKKSINNFMQHLIDLKKAPVLDETYFGPVVVNKIAVAELYSKQLFENGKMNAKRDNISTSAQRGMPGMSTSNLSDKIDDEVLSQGFNIIDDPSVKIYNGVKTIGQFSFDAEGVMAKPLKLIDNGILKTLYNNRTPSLKVSESNGHYRYKVNYSKLDKELAPGVVSIINENSIKRKKLIKAAKKIAKKNGQDYYIEIDQLQTEASGSSMEGSNVFTIFASGGGNNEVVINAFRVYKVYLKDGKRELVRPVAMKGVSEKLKEVKVTTPSNYVYNTMKSYGGNSFNFIISSSGGLNGTPSTFIVPESIMFERLKVEKQKILSTNKLPAVTNPVL